MTPEQMEERLKQAYPDSDVVVIDLTGGQDHFEVRIAATEFKDLSRMAQHRAIMDVFSQELASGEVHALSVRTLVKGE